MTHLLYYRGNQSRDDPRIIVHHIWKTKGPFDIFTRGLLHRFKLYHLRVWGVRYERCLFRINPVNKVVSHVVLNSIGDAILRMTLLNICDWSNTLISLFELVIPKKRVKFVDHKGRRPQIKDDHRVAFIATMGWAFPRYRVILPRPVHTVVAP